MKTFDYIISPLTGGEFFQQYFEKKHLHISATDSNKFKRYLKEGDIDRILTSQQLSIPNTRMAQKDGDIDIKKLTLEGTNIIDVSKVVEYFSEGATLIMSMLHNKLTSLKGLCDDLSHTFGQQFQTNVYCTPGNKSQGFIVHHDTHDVFILQIEGTKDWKIYKSPISLAIKDLAFEKDVHKHGSVIDEFTMFPGDILYIPRGLMHAAQTTSKKSIHITTGFMGITWQDVMIDKINLLAQKNEALRRGFKPNYWKDTQDPYYKDSYNEILNLLNNPNSIDEALKTSYKKNINRYRPAFTNPIQTAESILGINLDSKLRVIPYISHSIDIENDTLKITLFNKEIELSLGFKPVLDFIISEKTFVVRQLPLLDDESAVKFAQTLIKSGLIEPNTSKAK